MLILCEIVFDKYSMKTSMEESMKGKKKVSEKLRRRMEKILYMVRGNEE